MKPQYLFLILFALFITGLADGIEAALAGLGAAPGLVPIIGTAVATVSAPLGIVLGIAVSWCINVTMGIALMFLLAYFGMFYPQYLFPGLVVEAVPGLDALPFWALVVALCVLKKIGEEKQGVLGSVARIASSAALVSENPLKAGNALKTMRAVQQERTAQISQAPITAAPQPQDTAQAQRIGNELKTVAVKPAAQDTTYVPKAA